MNQVSIQGNPRSEGRKVRGRPRCPQARQSILDASLKLLEERGFARMTIEAIAAEAGVGKPTIYRWWPDKASIVMDAFLSKVSPLIPFHDSGSAREDIRLQMRRVIRLFRGKYGRTLAALIANLPDNPELGTAFHTRYLDLRRSVARKVIERGVANGEFRTDLDPELMMDALYGPFYFYLMITPTRLTPKNSDDLVKIVLDQFSNP